MPLQSLFALKLLDKVTRIMFHMYNLLAASNAHLQETESLHDVVTSVKIIFNVDVRMVTV